MAQHYENILPLLIKRSEGQNVQEEDLFNPFEKFQSLFEEYGDLLLEDKIPPTLLKAYRKVGRDYADYISDRDGHQPEVINHAAFKDLTDQIKGVLTSGRDRKNVPDRDLGSATYKKLTKQQTVDFLQLDIRVDDVPLDINAPFPHTIKPSGAVAWPKLTVTTSADDIADKIIQLRFIVGGNLYIIQKGSDGYYNPLLRTQIPASAFEKAGLPVRIAGEKGERLPKWMHWYKNKGSSDEPNYTESLNNVYAWIKLADEIFQTNDFDKSLELDSIKQINSNIILFLQGQATSLTVDYLRKIYYLKRFKESYQKDSVNMLTASDAYLENMLNIVNDLIPEDILNINFSKMESLSKVVTVGVNGKFELKPDLQTAYSKITSWIPSTNLLRPDLPSAYFNKFLKDWNKWVNEFQDEIEPKLKENINNCSDGEKQKILTTIINGSNSNLSNRQKQLANRLIQKDSKPLIKKVKPQGGSEDDEDEIVGGKIEKLPGAFKYSPYDYWQGRLTALENIGIIDTGDHHLQSLPISYRRLIDNVKIARKNLVYAQKAYNKVKANSDIYDDELEYQTELNSAKEELLNAQSEYKAVIKNCEKYAKKCIDGYDYLIQQSYKRFNNYYKTLQDMYGKMRQVADDITKIKNYSKDELIANFGAASVEEIKAIEKAIATCIDTKRRLEEAKQQHKAELEYLLRKVAEMQNKINSDDAQIAEQSNLFTTLNTQLEQSKGGVEEALIASYKARDELTQKGDQLLAEVNRFKQMHGVATVTNTPKPLKDDVLNLLTDLEDLTSETKLSTTEKEIVDDILDDTALDDPDEE